MIATSRPEVTRLRAEIERIDRVLITQIRDIFWRVVGLSRRAQLENGSV